MHSPVHAFVAFFGAFLAPWVWCSAAACVPGFTAQPAFPVGSNQGSNALVDLNRDGNLDLLTASAYLLGDGKGGFSAPTFLRGLPHEMFDVLALDFDRDRKVDLVLADLGGETLYVVFGGEPDGEEGYLFGEPLLLASVEHSWHLAGVDLDEDGFVDVVAAGVVPPALGIHRNNGDRTFRPVVGLMSSFEMVMNALAVGDFDGDGHADVGISSVSMAAVWFGDGTGALRQTAVANTVTIPGDVIETHRFCAADLDADGRAELLGVGVTQNPAAPGFLFGYWGSSIGPESGLPARVSFSYELPGGGRFLQVADINHDGALDLIAQGERMGRPGNFIKIFYGVREGGGYTVEPAPEFETALSGHGSVLAVADANNDGHLDIVLTDESSDEGEISLNDAGCGPDEAARGDVNVDGRLDIADAVTILAHLFARGFLLCRPAADTNSDAKIDLADAIYILQHLFASKPPPAPGMVACRQ